LLVLVEIMKNDEKSKVIMCDYRSFMHEMLGFSFKNMLTKVSNFYGEYHVWHPPSYDI
jgi:hypothetical protein